MEASAAMWWQSVGMSTEGWYVDPFGAHEQRWFSDGTPTALVLDHGVESTDEPPSPTFAGDLARPQGPTPDPGSDLLRADDVDAEAYDPDAGARAAFDTMDQIGPGVFWRPHHKR